MKCDRAAWEVVLAWARRVLAEQQILKQELSAVSGTLSGRLRIGVIPSASPETPFLTTPFCERHSMVSILQVEATSIEILRQLNDFALDLGITYRDNEPLKHMRALPLYDEEYIFVTQPGMPYS